MYKVLGKGERIVGIASITFALVYRVLADYAKIYIPDVIVFIVLLAAFGYLFFNRVVKLVIDAVKMRNKCFDTFFTIESIGETEDFGSRYKVFTVSYCDEENKLFIKEIHSAFSVRKWKVGDRVKIKVSREDPEKIIIPSSDIFLAVLMSLLGTATETAVIAVYVNIALKNR